MVIGSLDFLEVLQPFVIDMTCFMARWSMSYGEDLKSGEDLVVIWKPSLSVLIFASEDMARCHLCTFLSALLPFSYSRHTLDHMREQAGGMGLRSLVFLRSYVVHFLMLYMQYVELRARLCTRVEISQLLVLCWNGKWRKLQPCQSFAW